MENDRKYINNIIIKKDEIIKNIYNKIKNYDNVLNKNGFNNIDDLSKFIEKYKNHKCLMLNEIKDYINIKKEIDNITKIFIQQQNVILDYQIKGKIDETEEFINENILLNNKLNNLEYLTKIKEIENIENKIKSINIDNIIVFENDKEDKNKVQSNKYVQTQENNYFCPIYKNQKPKDIIEDMVYRETFINIKYNFEIYDNIKKNTNPKKFDDIITYYLNNKGMKVSSASNRQYYRNLIKRSWELYDKYEIRLSDLNFNLTSMSRINEDKWKYWLKYIDRIINN